MTAADGGNVIGPFSDSYHLRGASPSSNVASKNWSLISRHASGVQDIFNHSVFRHIKAIPTPSSTPDPRGSLGTRAEHPAQRRSPPRRVFRGLAWIVAKTYDAKTWSKAAQSVLLPSPQKAAQFLRSPRFRRGDHLQKRARRRVAQIEKADGEGLVVRASLFGMCIWGAILGVRAFDGCMLLPMYVTCLWHEETWDRFDIPWFLHVFATSLVLLSFRNWDGWVKEASAAQLDPAFAGKRKEPTKTHWSSGFCLFLMISRYF